MGLGAMQIGIGLLILAAAGLALWYDYRRVRKQHPSPAALTWAEAPPAPSVAFTQRAAARAAVLLAADVAFPPVHVDEALCSRLLASSEDPAPRQLFEVIPGGMRDRLALARLLESPKPYSGLVVSIGVQPLSGHAERDRDLIRNIEAFLAGLLREGDFACRAGADEFVLLCPADRAAAAPRRLSLLSEHLWDFQLRSIGAFPILFCWGAAEARGESLAEAFAAASERMQETRRSRAAARIEAFSQRRQAM